MNILKKEYEQIERLACAALNLLVQLGEINAGVLNILVPAGRHDMITDKLNKRREELEQQAATG